MEIPSNNSSAQLRRLGGPMVILKVQLLYTFAHAFDEEAVLCIDEHAGGRDGVDELVELDVTDSNSFINDGVGFTDCTLHTALCCSSVVRSYILRAFNER